MKVNIIDTTNKKTGTMQLPKQFEEEIRADLVARAVKTLQANSRQPYGASPEAGKRASAILSKRRKVYRGSYGFGIARTPRKILSRRGRRMMWVGAVAPNTVGGRRAHPPKASKITIRKLNVKETKKAVRVALAATVQSDLVKERGHHVPAEYPFIVDASLDACTKTKDVHAALMRLGFSDELARIEKRTIRPGKGTMRGRKYRTRKGPLIVVTQKSKLFKASHNIPGIDIVDVKNLNAEHLAPGASLGRLTLWTQAAVDTIEKEKLFA